MNADRAAPTTIDEYIEAFPPEVQAILGKVRATIRQAAPRAEERISYRMPAFFLAGVLVYFGGFKEHIGLFPPVRETRLRREAAAYAGAKGNLRFPLDQPIPYGLIRRIVRARVRENQAALRTRAARRRRA